MKATSKLISVVLILAMCLSLFATSAFADNGQIVIGGNSTGGNSTDVIIAEGNYSSSQESMNSALPEANDSAAGGSEGEAEESGAAILRNGVETKYDSLTAALNAAEDGDTVKLYSKELSYASALQINASITLDLNGRTINFESNEEKPAAFVVNGDSDVVVKNGKINLVGKAAEGENAAAGFQDLFVANEKEASFQQESLNVVRFTPEQWAEANKPVNSEQKTEEIQQTAVEEKTEQPAENTEDRAADEEEQEQIEVLPVVTPVEGQENKQAEGQTPAAEGEENGEEGENQAADIVEEKAEGEEGEGEADPAAEGEGEENSEEGENQAADIVEEKAEDEETEGEAEPVTEDEADPAAEGEAETDPAQIEGEGAAADELEVNEEPVNITEESEKPVEIPERVEGDNSTEEKTVTVSGFDSVTGAEVTITLKGKNPPEGLSVSVSAASADEIDTADGEGSFLALDITLMLDGEEYHMQEHKEDVSVATVYVSHPDLAGKDVVVDHIVENADGSTYQKTENSAAPTDDGVVFNTTSFSKYIFFPYEDPGTTDSAQTGSEGDVHHKDIKITNTSGEVWKKDPPGSDLTFEISGGAAPSSISIVDPEYASSGNVEYYKAGVLKYLTDYTISPDPSTDPTADPFKVTIAGTALKNVPTGKWSVVFWFQDKAATVTTPVYIIKSIIVAPKAEVTAVSPLEDGILTFEKCDYTPVQIKVTAEVTDLSITKADGKASVTFNLTNKTATVKTVDVYGNPKTLKISAGGAYEVTDYTAYDPLSHAFVSSKSLNIYAALLRWLPFGNDYTISVTTKDGSKNLPLHIVPGISVADGLTDYIKGKNTWIKFVACAPIDYDLDGTLAISIGGQKISHDYYSISDDHMTLWIYRNLLDQLRSNNSYTLTARLWMLNGPNNKITWENRTAQFNILAAGSTSYKSPKTGDNANIGLWAAVLVVSGAAVVALIPKKKKF